MSVSQMNVQMEYLEVAGNMLDRHDNHDVTAPGLLEVTGITQHGMATVSGLNDYDYQNISSLSLGHKKLDQLRTVSKAPIPPEVLEHFKNIKCHCMMGLFPEIGRAWLTIDSDIYIWTYEQTRDVAYYDGLNHLIVSVGLVTPKPGVFIADVKYLLILTTPVEIVVLGVTFGDTTKTISSPIRSINTTTTYEEMQLMNKPIFILNTDNVAISTIEGTADGRIFLGGRDGFLYEVHYQAASTWFGKRCKKINHSQGIISYMVPGFLKVFSETDPIVRISIDNSRQLLYVLTEKGSIEAWDMGADCNSMKRIAKVAQYEIAFHASNIIKTVDVSVFKTIKAICALTANDCSNLHLIAVTQCGVRMYFSTTPLQVSPQQPQQVSGGTSSYDSSRPQGLYLLHVRLPPGYTPNTTVGKPKQVHSAYYNKGTLLMVSTPQQDQDMLWSISSEPFPNRPYLAESATVLPLDGMVWGLAEMRHKSKSTLSSVLRHSQTPKKVVLLTNQGAHIISLLKSVDILQQLLVACHGPHHEAIKGYFQAQTELEACATALALACMPPYRGTDVALWAAQAFMLYGGEPSIGTPYLTSQFAPGQRSFISSPGGGFSDRSQPQIFMSTPFPGRGAMPGNMPQSNVHHAPYPFSPTGPHSFQQNHADTSNINYSAKHAGLYLYVARLLRPIWRKRCIDANLGSTITQADCTEILEDLHAVKGFLEANSVSDISNAAYGSNQAGLTNGFGHPGQSMNQSSVEQAQAEEKRSLTALNFFIKHCCEVISLWKILCEHQFQLLVNALSKEQQNILTSCTFRDLTLSRADTCAHLIVNLINSYLNDNASVSSISSKLRDVCPNLYRHEDAVSYKATEILMLSKGIAVDEEKEERLRTALQLCKDAAPNLPLTNICQQFTSSGFYQGVIELTATCAAKLDPKEAAIHYYRNNEPNEDQEGYLSFTARMNCYKEVRQMLETVYQNLCNASTTADLKMSPDGIEKDIQIKVMRIVSIAIQSSDPLLHVVVYEWLLSRNLLSELLSLTEPSLGEFFRRSAIRNPENLQLADLLWKYYEKNGQHAAAAKILDNLASLQTNALSLVQRIEYLARAVMCMRNDNVGYSVHNGVLLKDLEDKLEISRVQKVILDAIATMVDSTTAQEAVASLNYGLYNMTQLYSDFADPFDLWECKLVILNCSHHNDPILIESVWTQIINREIEQPGSSQEKCTKLLTKVQTLVKEFGDSGQCFPLAFLVRELEIRCCQLKLSPSTIPDALVGMNIDIELLIDYYARMISMNERVWANEGNEWHLVQASTRLITLLTNVAQQIPSRNRKRIMAKAQELISACLHLLYPKPRTENLQQQLKEIESRVQRIM